MPTPFRDGEVDASAIRFNVERWMALGFAVSSRWHQW
jgi:hypothetical protein